MLLKNQKNVSPQRGLPVDDVGATSVIETITAETVQLYYWNSGVRTIDAGQAAGTVVEGVLGYDNIKNSSGTMEGNKLDTSLGFTSGVFTTEVEIDEVLLESLDDVSGSDRATALTASLSNGEYVVDYSNGVLYGKKATTGTTLAATTYKIKVGQVGTSGSAVSSNVNVAKVAGNTTAVGAGNVNTGTQRTTLADDDPAVTALQLIDDAIKADEATFTEASDKVMVAGGNDADGDQAKAMAVDSEGKVKSASYSSASNADRIEEIDPLNLQYVSETLLDLTNIDETTTGYGYIDMSGAKYVGIQGETSGTTPTDVLTVTLEATIQDDGTAAASCDYQDVTNALTGSASFVDTDFTVLIDTALPVKYLRVKYTTSTGGGDDADLTVYVKKLY